MPETDGLGLGDNNRITLAIDIARIGITLVQKHPARGQRPQADGRIRARQDQLLARKPLARNGVAGIFAVRLQCQCPQVGVCSIKGSIRCCEKRFA